MDVNLVFRSEIFADFFFRRQKIESCKSSETRFGEVSRRSEPCSRGKRTFKALSRLGRIQKFSDPGRFEVFLANQCTVAEQVVDSLDVGGKALYQLPWSRGAVLADRPSRAATDAVATISTKKCLSQISLHHTSPLLNGLFLSLIHI